MAVNTPNSGQKQPNSGRNPDGIHADLLLDYRRHLLAAGRGSGIVHQRILHMMFAPTSSARGGGRE